MVKAFHYSAGHDVQYTIVASVHNKQRATADINSITTSSKKPMHSMSSIVETTVMNEQTSTNTGDENTKLKKRTAPDEQQHDDEDYSCASRCIKKQRTTGVFALDRDFLALDRGDFALGTAPPKSSKTGKRLRRQKKKRPLTSKEPFSPVTENKMAE
jgi:hypothetical protein